MVYGNSIIASYSVTVSFKNDMDLALNSIIETGIYSTDEDGRVV
jgi:hypothetical protein